MTTALRALTAALLGIALLGVPAALAPPASAQVDVVGGAQLGGPGVVLGLGAPAVPKEVVAQGWLVADLDTGQVLGAKNAHGRFAPASTLKILTAVALAPLLPPDRKLVPEFDDVAVDGSKVGLVERVGYPVDELFQAMMMVSGNDVAMTLARGAGGPAAIEAMNAEATRLQALDTHAVNPSGLDADGQLSSAYDLALLARAGMASPDFRRWVSTRRGSVSGPGGKRIATVNHNKLLATYDGALGIKNGYTTRAKASFVGAATRNGHTLLVTLMRTQPRVHVEAAALLDWGFAAVSRGTQPIGTLVDPAADPVTPAPAVDQAVVRRPVGAPAAAPSDGAGLPVQALSGGALLGAILLVRRRRQVVLARSARRAAARAGVGGTGVGGTGVGGTGSRGRPPAGRGPAAAGARQRPDRAPPATCDSPLPPAARPVPGAPHPHPARPPTRGGGRFPAASRTADAGRLPPRRSALEDCRRVALPPAPPERGAHPWCRPTSRPPSPARPRPRPVCAACCRRPSRTRCPSSGR